MREVRGLECRESSEAGAPTRWPSPLVDRWPSALGRGARWRSAEADASTCRDRPAACCHALRARVRVAVDDLLRHRRRGWDSSHGSEPLAGGAWPQARPEWAVVPDAWRDGRRRSMRPVASSEFDGANGSVVCVAEPVPEALTAGSRRDSSEVTGVVLRWRRRVGGLALRRVRSIQRPSTSRTPPRHSPFHRQTSPHHAYGRRLRSAP